jgi:hypothetical protein
MSKLHGHGVIYLMGHNILFSYLCIYLLIIFIVFYTYIHTASQIFRRDAHVLPKLDMRNTADVTGDKSIAVWSQSISGENADNPLVAFYDIHGRKREVLYFYFVPETTRDCFLYFNHFLLRLLFLVLVCYFFLSLTVAWNTFYLAIMLPIACIFIFFLFYLLFCIFFCVVIKY